MFLIKSDKCRSFYTQKENLCRLCFYKWWLYLAPGSFLCIFRPFLDIFKGPYLPILTIFRIEIWQDGRSWQCAHFVNQDQLHRIPSLARKGGRSYLASFMSIFALSSSIRRLDNEEYHSNIRHYYIDSSVGHLFWNCRCASPQALFYAYFGQIKLFSKARNFLSRQYSALKFHKMVDLDSAHISSSRTNFIRPHPLTHKSNKVSTLTALYRTGIESGKVEPGRQNVPTSQEYLSLKYRGVLLTG